MDTLFCCHFTQCLNNSGFCLWNKGALFPDGDKYWLLSNTHLQRLLNSRHKDDQLNYISTKTVWTQVILPCTFLILFFLNSCKDWFLFLFFPCSRGYVARKALPLNTLKLFDIAEWEKYFFTFDLHWGTSAFCLETKMHCLSLLENFK